VPEIASGPVWIEVSSLRHPLGAGTGMNGTMLEMRA
jgi:hypothetical protein